MAAGLLDDLPKVALALGVAGLALTAAWTCLDRRSPWARWLRQRWAGSPRARAALMLALGLGVFGAVAEDVLLQEHTEWILQLDGHVRAMTRPLAATPALRRAAALVSRATGPGLGAAVLVGSALLWRRGRREDAALLLGGTTGAWALAALLKLAFAVPRPSAASAVHALTAYGFPSGHVLVTTVACGLGGRVLGREAPPVVRGALLLTGLAVVGLTAAARVVLNAHWLSDVAGGAAMGLAWLATILLAVGPHPGSRVPASSS